jgi:hypothetical protein
MNRATRDQIVNEKGLRCGGFDRHTEQQHQNLDRVMARKNRVRDLGTAQKIESRAPKSGTEPPVRRGHEAQKFEAGLRLGKMKRNSRSVMREKTPAGFGGSSLPARMKS